MKETCYIGLGSNLGNRADFLAMGRAGIANIFGVKLVACSGIWETEAVEMPGGAPFYNQVVQICTDLSADDLLANMLAIELCAGRRQKTDSGVYAARELDLDLLLYGDAIICSATLHVPHPRLHLRRFVLCPLSELAAELVIPGICKSVQTLLKQVENQNVHRLESGLGDVETPGLMPAPGAV